MEEIQTKMIEYTLRYGCYGQTHDGACSIPVNATPEEINALILEDAYNNGAIIIEFFDMD